MSIATVPDYLDALQRELDGEPSGLIQDALADAEEHLCAAMAQEPDRPEAQILASVIESYGTPEQVAAEYRGREPRGPYAGAGSPARREESGSLLRRFFSVIIDPQAYAALFYMFLAPMTGAFYFTWVTTGLSLSAGLLTVIVGALVFLAFVGSVRLISLVEGRIVETLLGVRMPRRLPYEPVQYGVLTRIQTALLDRRTWTSILYMAAMLPLGVIYFVLAVLGLAAVIVLTAVPMAQFQSDGDFITYSVAGSEEPRSAEDLALDLGDWAHWIYLNLDVWWLPPLMVVIAILSVLLLLHLSKCVAWLHGRLAEHLLVRLPS